jgi:hypothetical protein
MRHQTVGSIVHLAYHLGPSACSIHRRAGRQKGARHVKLVFSSVVLVVTLGAFGCGTPAGGAQASGAQAGNAAARESIVKAQRAQASQRAYVVNTTMTLETGVSANTMLSYVAPDRYHSMDLDGPQMQVIRIGDRGWMRAKDDPWQPEIVNTANTLRRLRGPVAIDDAGYTVDSAQALGAGNHPREPTDLYEYVVKRDAETARVKMWVSKRSGLPISYEADVTNGTQREKSTWHVQYDDTIKIDPPAGAR